MEIFSKVNELKEYIAKQKEKNLCIGFVPTMGALHAGHLSLIKKAGEENDIVVCSIFVNPEQFNDPVDFQNYPRDLNLDISKFKGIKCDAVFIPSVEEIYPKSDNPEQEPELDFGFLDKIMEGQYRPGHFNGVVKVVRRLLNLVTPDNAYFGEKDFQQFLIIKKMVELLNIPVNIVSCAIVREYDGLAMSSRNALLNPLQRQKATFIHSTLRGAKQRKLMYSPLELRNWVINEFENDDLLSLEYFEIVEAETLKQISYWKNSIETIGCIAVKIGNVRLIDNIKFTEGSKLTNNAPKRKIKNYKRITSYL
ncbi:MAG: pantoate--beta-alanine ligase [Bacteroidota bacterium]|nr:pantoate--beta-alanine ligase [Bacteroidota bacterium]